MQKWLYFMCGGKIKNFCWAFLDGHPVKILKILYQDMNQKCKTDRTNHIHFLQDLTQICTQKYNQFLNFPVHTKKASGSYQGDFLTRIDWSLEGYFSFSSEKSDYPATTKIHRKTFRNFKLVLEIPCMQRKGNSLH